MLRILADALLLAARQAPLPRNDHRHAGNPDIEEARLRRAASLSGKAY
jgi:hypothetical protein